MRSRTFIFGAGDLARVLLFYMQQDGFEPEGFVVDDAWCREESFCKLPLIPFSRMEEQFPAENYSTYVAIGYGGMNAGRRDAFRRLRAMDYETPNYIHHSVLNGSNAVGEGNLIFPGVVLDAYTEIGDCNVFYPSVLIAHDCKIGSFNFFAPRSALAGDITVGNRCFFGVNCTVKNGLRISDRCLIGAAAFVTANLEEASVLAAPKSVLLEKNSETIIEKVMKK